MSIEFEAIPREVQTKYLVSGDKSHRLLLETDDDVVMEVGKISPQTRIKVTIEVIEDKEPFSAD